MARLCANENLPLLVVAELRRLGHDVWTVGETGTANRAVLDSEILDFAVLHRRAVLTLNGRHFIEFAKAQPFCSAFWAAHP
jgi:hypothetical protein